MSPLLTGFFHRDWETNLPYCLKDLKEWIPVNFISHSNKTKPTKIPFTLILRVVSQMKLLDSILTACIVQHLVVICIAHLRTINKYISSWPILLLVEQMNIIVPRYRIGCIYKNYFHLMLLPPDKSKETHDHAYRYLGVWKSVNMIFSQ